MSIAPPWFMTTVAAMIRIHRSRCIPRWIGKRAAVSMCNGVLPFSRVPGYEIDDSALRATDKSSIFFVQIAENMSALCFTDQDHIATEIGNTVIDADVAHSTWERNRFCPRRSIGEDL
jgi:hypothetical protein